MQHHLYFENDPINSGIKIPLDTSYYEHLTELPMDAEFIYQTLLFNTINNAFNYCLVQPENEAEVLHQFQPDEYETTMFYFSIEDPKREVIVPVYLHILKPVDGFINKPIIHSVLTMSDEDGLIKTIGTGMHYSVDNQLLGMVNFEYEGEPYSFNFACAYNDAAKHFEIKTHFESEDINFYLNEGLPYTFFNTLINYLKTDDLEKAESLVENVLNATEHLNIISYDNDELLGEKVPLVLTPTDRLYTNSNKRDASSYGSLFEVLERTYHHQNKDGLLVPLCLKLKIIKAKDTEGNNHDLALAVFSPFSPNGEEQTIEHRDHVGNEVRLMMQVGDDYILIGGGQGNSLVSNFANQDLPYTGGGGFYYDDTYGTFIYSNEAFSFEGEMFEVIESFDVHLDYQRMLDAKKLEDHPMMYLEATFDPIGSELPIELKVPKAELEIAYTGLDNDRQMDNVRDLMEYLNNQYVYMKDGKYYSPVWTSLQVGKVLDRKTGWVYEGYLVVFNPFGVLPIMPTPEQIEYFEDLDEEDQDEILGNKHGDFVDCETRLILRRKGKFSIVGRGDALFSPETKDYYGDGECIINDCEYSFNYTTDSFYLVEAQPTKDRVFFGKSSKVEIDYQAIEQEEKTRRRSVE